MLSFPITPVQQNLIDMPISGNIFLEGPAGTGKTTAASERLYRMINTGIQSGSILLLLPQRTLAFPYSRSLSQLGLPAGGVPTISTLAGLAKRMVELFWPIVSKEAGFGHPDKPPIFLTLETAQYYMARIVRPLFDQGYFESVNIQRNRLYSQILDNLNKAAVVDFPYTTIGARLKAAWMGDVSQAHVYDDAQECALLFRRYCLEHNLLDFSLQIEVFFQYLWPDQYCRDYLFSTYRHLIYDNLEEDTPVAHDIIRDWLLQFDSALLIFDHDGGYRNFLGADPKSGKTLKSLCDQGLEFSDSFVNSPNLQFVASHLSRQFNLPMENHTQNDLLEENGNEVGTEPALFFQSHRYHPQMHAWIANQVANLVYQEQVPPGEIAVLAPFLSDALRFSLMDSLQGLKIPSTSHRPSRTLRDEPATQCLLTLSILAHPDWGMRPSKFDLAYAFVKAIEDLDLIRAQLLADIVYHVQQGKPVLTSFDRIRPEVQERITFTFGSRYELLRTWLENYLHEPIEELDHFLSRLFGEVLSQPGFGFHRDYGAGEVAANLVESAQKFRQVTGGEINAGQKPVGQEYIELVQEGVVAAQYISRWQIKPDNAVFIAPAYTFMMSNRVVDVQFWLDIGSMNWFERLYQPLTHPYVLSRHWPAGVLWTDVDELQAGQQSLARLIVGLIRRCRSKIYLAASELGEQGYEQNGYLLKAIQRLSRQAQDIITMN